MTESRKAVSGFLKEESMFGKLQKKVFDSAEDVTVSVLPATLVIKDIALFSSHPRD